MEQRRLLGERMTLVVKISRCSSFLLFRIKESALVLLVQHHTKKQQQEKQQQQRESQQQQQQHQH
jgi:hypothetical protein